MKKQMADDNSLYQVTPGKEQIIGRKLVRRPRKPKIEMHVMKPGPKNSKFRGQPLGFIRPDEELLRDKKAMGSGDMKKGKKEKSMKKNYISVMDAANLARIMDGTIQKQLNPGILASAGRAAVKLFGRAKTFASKALPGFHAKRVKRYKALLRKPTAAVHAKKLKEGLYRSRRARNVRYGIGGLAVLGGARGVMDRKNKRVPEDVGQYSY